MGRWDEDDVEDMVVVNGISYVYPHSETGRMLEESYNKGKSAEQERIISILTQTMDNERLLDTLVLRIKEKNNERWKL